MGLSPTPQIIDRVMGTPRHLLRQVRCDSMVTLTSCSLSGKVLLSPTSPQPAVLHLLPGRTLTCLRGSSCTASVRLALPLSWDRRLFVPKTQKNVNSVQLCVILKCFVLLFDTEEGILYLNFDTVQETIINYSHL